MKNNLINNDLVSIILPVYNAKHTLKRAVKSIINQTHNSWELIIIDDGSSDNSTSIIREINDIRIKKIFLKKNKGVVHCLNIGINASAGNYIARMDADDISLPERLFCQLDFLNKNNMYDLVGSQQLIFNENTKIILSIYPKNAKKYLSKEYYFSYKIPHPTWMARSQWLKKNSYYDNNIYSEDQELLIRASVSSNYYLMEKPLLLYSSSEISLSKKLSANKNIFIKKLLHYYLYRNIYTYKLLVNIPLDTLFFIIKSLFYLLKAFLNEKKISFHQSKSINVSSKIYKILNDN